MENFTMTGKLMLALAMSAILGGTAFAANDEFAKVEIQGQLKGEQNQTWVEVDGQQYFLDLGNSRSLIDFADRHDGDTVRISGSLEQTRRGAVIVVNRFEAPNTETNYSQTQRYEQPAPVHERTIIREKKDKPFFKVGPLEIGN